MKILSLTLASLTTFSFGLFHPILADSHGHFPGTGSVDAYNRSCLCGDKAIEYSHKGDNSMAIKYDREAVSIYPYDSAHYYNLGDHLSKLDKTAEAINAFEQAVTLEPRYLNAWLNLGLSYLNEGKLSEAERCYRKAVELNPVCWEALGNLGDALRQQGKFAEAGECIYKAKALPTRTSGEAVNADDRAQLDDILKKCNSKDRSP